MKSSWLASKIFREDDYCEIAALFVICGFSFCLNQESFELFIKPLEITVYPLSQKLPIKGSHRGLFILIISKDIYVALHVVPERR